MKNLRTKLSYALYILLAAFAFSCTDADVASNNLREAADQFEIYRRVVFYNGITEYNVHMLSYSRRLWIAQLKTKGD